MGTTCACPAHCATMRADRVDLPAPGGPTKPSKVRVGRCSKCCTRARAWARVRMGGVCGMGRLYHRRGALPGAPQRCHNACMDYRHLLIDTADGIATVTLNRPEKRNALALDVMQELTQALQSLAASSATRGVILAANGPVFSAGHNFADMVGATLAQTQALFAVCTDLMNQVQAMPQPVVARVHALATAAGCQLVATCDLAVAADTASFAIPGGKAGLFCHTPLVAVGRNIGRKRALEMALTGDSIDAATAADWGLINHAVPAAELEAATLDLVQRA